MATFNKVILVGRLTRDPEVRTFANGGKVAKFSFAVSNRKKNAKNGQWEDDPLFIDCEVFNRGEHGKTADLIEKSGKKGMQLLVEGKLAMDSWEDKNGGGKRTKTKVVVDSIQFVDRIDTKDQVQSEQKTRSGAYSSEESAADLPSSGEDDVPF